MHNLRLSPVLGYLIVGAVIGEHGLQIVENHTYTNALAEFGVVFLLFVIGLELTFERLLQMRWHVFGFGSLQIVITTYLLSLCIGSLFALNKLVSIVIAGTLALSSTAIVIQVLNEHKRQNTQVGRLALAGLLMQDFAVVPLLTIMPMLGGANNHDQLMGAMGIAGLKALLTIVGITIIGRIFLRPFFSIIGSVKTDEVYVTTALLIVLGAAWITSELQLSTAMGAFLAGLLIAETEYGHKIEDSIMPFQGLFLALFFLTVGMSIDIKFILDNFKLIILLSVGLISIKAGIIFILAKSFHFSLGRALHCALLLAQGSEFAFILFSLADKQRVMDHNLSQTLLMVVAFTMAITPLLAIVGAKIETALAREREEVDGNLEFQGVSDMGNHVIIAGFGRVGRIVAHMLSEEQICYVALENNAAVVKKAKSRGFPVYQGDFTNLDTLHAVGIKKAAAIILSTSEKPSISKTIKTIIRNRELKHLQIISRVEDYRHAKWIKKLGAHLTVPTTIETGLQLGGAALKLLEISENKILDIKNKLRKNDYLLVEEAEILESSNSDETV